jgi:hypothetical protein
MFSYASGCERAMEGYCLEILIEQKSWTIMKRKKLIVNTTMDIRMEM